jgi:hypothetical protein
MTATPITEEHEGVLVVRDDLFPGGTKARFLPTLFEDANEIVYASSAQGGAQYSLAYVANKLGKRATIFSPARKVPHPRQLEACRFGAQVIPVKPGYLSLCIARALKYCEETGAKLAPFGMSSGGCIEIIADAARLINCKPKQVWCAAGSGRWRRRFVGHGRLRRRPRLVRSQVTLTMRRRPGRCAKPNAHARGSSCSGTWSGQRSPYENRIQPPSRLCREGADQASPPPTITQPGGTTCHRSK